MERYLVRWEIEVYAYNPEEAVEKALADSQQNTVTAVEAELFHVLRLRTS